MSNHQMTVEIMSESAYTIQTNIKRKQKGRCRAQRESNTWRQLREFQINNQL